MLDLLFWALVGAAGGAAIAIAIDAIIENFVKPFFNKCRVNKATVVKKKDLNKLLRSVSSNKRREAEAVMAVLNAQPNDVVMFGKDDYGQVWYDTVSNIDDCEDLQGAAYEVSRSGYKEKIYIG